MITFKLHSIDAKISLVFYIRKNPIEFYGFWQFFEDFQTKWFLMEIFNAKLFYIALAVQKGAYHQISFMQKGWKHFPKLILNES